MKISQKKEASLQDTHILIIIFLSIFWFSDNQDLGNLIKIYNTGEILFFSPGVNFILGYMPYPTHQTLACHIASKNSMLFSHRAIQDFCSFPPTTTHFHTFFFHFVCGVCIRIYLFMDVFSSCMHTWDQRLMLNVLLSLPLPFCFGDRVSDWIWSSSIQLVGKTHRTCLSLSPSAGLQTCTPVHTWLPHGYYRSELSSSGLCSHLPSPNSSLCTLNPLFPFLTPALFSLFLHHTSLFLVPQAHKVPFYLCAFTCKALPAPHPLRAKLLQIFVQILPAWRGLLLDISRSYTLSPMITGLINTATISYLLGWLPDYCFSLPEVSKLYAGRQTVSTLCSLYSQLMVKKKNLLTNGTVTVCQMTELQTVMLWELCQVLSHIYVYLQRRDGGEKKTQFFL